MSSKDLTKINIAIGGRTYPLKVPKNEEQLVKEVEKIINAKIAEMRNQYDLGEIDHISMALLAFVYETEKNNNQHIVNTKIDKIDNLLDANL
ncbi:MAG TPA: cell division protein ZapA [Saprospiraceae bacterium]|nr:cell division protein ZapA [Saprospiraceae bacterium]MCB9328091.1 cell division protein ZapA [Lewinellaceae bacterium]HPK09278.1 cell division protein ZapA [Saprospiraceae bacterium]HPQ20709.1 cell division protein ZapA [Saprospiraceae bacterium]HRX29392.1 cell division protein ZapA [Saprospiraceae bacterium]